MSVAERIKLCVELSRAALRFSAARPPERDKDLVDLAELDEIERRD